MVRDELSVMSAFLAVADERSFTKVAAARTSPSAIASRQQCRPLDRWYRHRDSEES